MTAIVYVWRASVSATPTDAITSLPTDELARARRLRRPQDRRRRLVASQLLHHAVAWITGCPADDVRIERCCYRCGPGDHGRPVVVAPDDCIEVSAAHAGDQVMVACARGVRLGIDVEEEAGVAFDDVAAVALSDRERDGVTTTRELARTWARKEALLKATGLGLAYPPAGLVLTAPHESPRVLEWAVGRPDGTPRQIALRDLHAEFDYVAALAVMAPDPTVVELDRLSLFEARAAPAALDSVDRFVDARAGLTDE